ncbi:MAG: exonuclease domain-containing protein [Victivallaceae bacterium]|nr:3'-5' exonuclease [Victivallaceae bacterium]
MLEELNLKRPLVFFDLEATGVDPLRDRIVEISTVKVLPGGECEQPYSRRVNPTIPIPPGATAVHHITDADVAAAPTFTQIAGGLMRYLDDCDLAGYNITGYDIPLLCEEFKRAGMAFSLENRRVVDAFAIFVKMFPRTLTGAYKFFCGKDLDDAHSAAADTAATLEVFAGELARYPEIPRDLDLLHEFCDNRDPDAIDANRRFKFDGAGVPVVNFGRYKGRPLREIAADEPGFLKWVVKGDFPDDVKQVALDALCGKFPERAPQE